MSVRERVADASEESSCLPLRKEKHRANTVQNRQVPSYLCGLSALCVLTDQNRIVCSRRTKPGAISACVCVLPIMSAPPSAPMATPLHNSVLFRPFSASHWLVA